jgi:radical SAM-linked protein
VSEPSGDRPQVQNREAPHPQPPAVQRLRIRYAKRGRMRFASVRDFQRALERALRRAGLPMAYSQGFSPHPKISYLPAVPTGVASEAEYVEIALQERRDPAQVAVALDAALPDGLDVLTVVVAAGSSLGERLTGSVAASSWRFEMRGVDADTLRHGVSALLGLSELRVPRTTKSGRTEIDVRAALVSADVRDEPDVADPCAILLAVVRHGTPSVRPDDVLAGLRDVAGLTPPVPVMATRLAQGPLDEETGTVLDPLT